jgi:hypothetical protein
MAASSAVMRSSMLRERDAVAVELSLVMGLPLS